MGDEIPPTGNFNKGDFNKTDFDLNQCSICKLRGQIHSKKEHVLELENERFDSFTTRIVERLAKSIQDFDSIFLVIPDYILKESDYYYDRTWEEVVKRLGTEFDLIKVAEGKSLSWAEDEDTCLGFNEDRELDEDDYNFDEDVTAGEFHHPLEIPAHKQPLDFRALILVFDNEADFEEVIIDATSPLAYRSNFRRVAFNESVWYISGRPPTDWNGRPIPLPPVDRVMGWGEKVDLLLPPENDAFEIRFQDIKKEFNIYVISTNPPNYPERYYAERIRSGNPLKYNPIWS